MASGEWEWGFPYSHLTIRYSQAAFTRLFLQAVRPSRMPMMSDSFMIRSSSTFDLHFGAGPFAEQHEIAGLHFGNDALAVLVERRGPRR
jgi:hypothetical protein